MPQAPHLPQECFASLHKAPLFSSSLNLKLFSVLCVPVWRGGAGGEVAREKGRQEKEGGADSRTSGSLFTLESPTPSLILLQGPWGRRAAVDREFSYPVGKGAAVRNSSWLNKTSIVLHFLSSSLPLSLFLKHFYFTY